MILVVNTSFPELDQLAAGFAEAGILSKYVRPYANLNRRWEKAAARFPGLQKKYYRTLGRRVMPPPLVARHILERGIVPDLAMAGLARLPVRFPGYKNVSQKLLFARNNLIASAAAKFLTNERIVIASWGCAEPVFKKMKRNRNCLRVLNCFIAHHRFTKRYLLQETEKQSSFSNTAGNLYFPDWLVRRLNTELDLADYIFVGSSFARMSFIEEGVPAEKVISIPYGADINLFSPPPVSRSKTCKFSMLFVGQICQRKGIPYLLEAAKQLKDSDISLTLIGNILCDTKALEPYRQFFSHVSHVPQKELRQFYRQADVFVFPTLVEGMGLVVLEAMSSGLPVITTSNGPSDIVRDGKDGYIVPPRDILTLVNRIERLRCNANLRRWMGENARKQATNFSWGAYRKAAVDCVKLLMDQDLRE